MIGGFDLHVPRHIAFGWGRSSDLGTIASSIGGRAFVVTGARSLDATGAWDRLRRRLEGAGLDAERFAGPGREPEVEDVDRAVEAGRACGPDFVVGIGGGSALDTAKAAAALIPQPGAASARDYLEGVGCGRVLEAAPLPWIAVPTTAGTGSEATKNAVISSAAGRFKRSLRHPAMIARTAIVDPELTVGLPRDATISSGMDALTQLIEAYLSRGACAATDALALDGIRAAFPALPRVVADPGDRGAREALAYASLLSGIALANAGLGLAHAIAPALGVERGIPHGLACAFLLPIAMETNRDAAREKLGRIGESFAGRRFEDPAEGAAVAIRAVRDLAVRLGVPGRLADLGVRREDLASIAAGSSGNSLRNNPRPLSIAEVEGILEAAL
ncbi:MAG: iron-containing alcohol dehydrogenase [Planctomycetes bacterium]|nr:iron-containing alcohol dehydrogenase [Planctomycetota bacterium]